MRRRPRAVLVGLLLSLVVMLAAGPASALTPEAKVSVAGPTTPYLPNAVNEPAWRSTPTTPTCWPVGAMTWSTAPPATAAAAI
jgi:hypothetical protein